VNPHVTDQNEAKTQIANSLLSQGAFGLLLMFLTIISFQDKPKTPPAANAIVPREENILRSYYLLITNMQFVKLAISFTMYYNNIAVVGTMIDEIVDKYGFNTDESGLFGIMIVVGGIIGSLLR